MSKSLPTTKYFKHPVYASNPTLVNMDIQTATGVVFGPFNSYDNAGGKAQIEAKLAKKFFSLLAHLDDTVARYQLDKNLP